MFLRIFFCRRRGGTASVGSTRKTSIAWTLVHAIVNQSTCTNPIVSEAVDGDTWRGEEASIFNWTHEITSCEQLSDGLHVDSSWHDLHLMADRGRSRSMIDGRSWPDRGAILAHLRQNQDHDHGRMMGHDRGVIVAIKPTSQPDQTDAIFGQKFHLKDNVSPPCSSTFDRFVKELSKFEGRS